MPCTHTNAVCVESTGGIESGRFSEKYQCPNCEAIGFITGDAGNDPETWNRQGEVFQ